MSTTPPSRESAEISRLRQQVDDLERALAAIRSGDVDALVVSTAGQVQLFSRTSADRPYQVLVEEMAAAVVTISAVGRIVFANQRLAEWLRCERGSLVGRPLQELVLAGDLPGLEHLLAQPDDGPCQLCLALRRSDGSALPVHAALGRADLEGERVLCLVAIPDSVASRGGGDELWGDRRRPRFRGAAASRQRSPDSPRGVHLRQALLWVLLLGVFLVDLVAPAELLAFYWIPLLLASSFIGGRQLLLLAASTMGLAILTGLRWSLFAGLDYWLRLAAMGLVSVISVLLARQRQISEQHLLDSEQRFRMLAENASDAVFRADLDGVTEWISQAVTALLGWRPDQLVGLPFDSFVHADDRPLLQKVYAAFARGERQVFRLRVRKAQGGHHWVQVTGRGALDAKGSVSGIIGSWRDIQAEVEAEHSRALKSSRLAATLDSLLDPHAVLRARRDETGTIVDFVYVEANEAACHYNLLSHEQLIGRSVLELLPAHRSTGLLAMYQRVIETGEPLVLNDFVYPHEILGGERHFDIRAVAMGDELSFTWRDVSDRYEQARALAASEEQYRLLAENSSDAVLRLADDATVLWVSPALTAMLGWQPQDWVAQPLADFLVDRGGGPQLLRQQPRLRQGETFIGRDQVRALDGSIHWLEIHASPWRDSMGAIDGSVISFRTIDSEVASEQELDRRARYDELTGLANRGETIERLHGLLRQRRHDDVLVLLFIDIDHFKSINDTHGHAAGDAVLCHLAERIRGCIRREDWAARIGGDELLVVLQGVPDLARGLSVAEAIRSRSELSSSDGPCAFTISIGVTVVGPGDTLDELLSRADRAMYEAKQQGRNRVVPIAA